jgi:hypothetical protein
MACTRTFLPCLHHCVQQSFVSRRVHYGLIVSVVINNVYCVSQLVGIDGRQGGKWDVENKIYVDY